MNRGAVRTAAALACLLALSVVAAGCGSNHAGGTVQQAAPPAPPLATASTSASGSTWTVVEMGGSAAQQNNFWELFVRQAGATSWREATPPGVADNGGLVVAGSGGESLLTGFRPSQDLTYSPLAASSDNGVNWSPTGLVSPGLANLPDALAAGPDGRLLALTDGGSAKLGTGNGSAWSRLTRLTALAATRAGRTCGLTSLTAAAFSSSATLLAGACSRPGTAGIFADTGGSWHAAGPAIPASMASDTIDVIRLTSTGSGVLALLRAGTGPDASLVAAFSPAGGSGTQWTLSPPLRIGSGQLVSTTVGTGFSVGVILNDGTGVTLAGPGASWQKLPALPRWAATLALGQSGAVDAIAAHASTFSDWRLESGAPGRWELAQTLRVSIPYGSSG